MLKEKGNASCDDCAWRQTPRGVKPTMQMYLLASLAANAEGGKNAAQHASYQICGFSLIELMAVIAIISVVSTFAIPDYQNYVVSANSTKLGVHHWQASNWVGAEMVRLQSRLAGGGHSAQVSEMRDEASEWVSALLADVADSDTASPSAGPAFAVAAAGSADDAITLSLSGNPTDGNLQVNITRPIYGNLESAEQTQLCWGGVVCSESAD